MRFLLQTVTTSAQSCRGSKAAAAATAIQQHNPIYEKTRVAGGPRISQPTFAVPKKRIAVEERIKNNNSTTHHASSPSPSSSLTFNQNSNNVTNCPAAIKSWGQQCSPNCGCVVRFEMQIDPHTDKILESNYYAKTVLTTTATTTTTATAQGKNDANRTLKKELVPFQTQNVMTTTTTRSTKPIFTECQCPTIHKLSTYITNYLPHKTVSQIRNSAEFTSVRTSLAFRHVALQNFGLAPNAHNTRCYDVVEEAFLASIRGYMPKPRRRQQQRRRQQVQKKYSPWKNDPRRQSDNRDGDDDEKRGNFILGNPSTTPPPAAAPVTGTTTATTTATYHNKDFEWSNINSRQSRSAVKIGNEQIFQYEYGSKELRTTHVNGTWNAPGGRGRQRRGRAHHRRRGNGGGSSGGSNGYGADSDVSMAVLHHSALNLIDGNTNNDDDYYYYYYHHDDYYSDAHDSNDVGAGGNEMAGVGRRGGVVGKHNNNYHPNEHAIGRYDADEVSSWDWVSYVDELYRTREEEERKRESA